MLKNKGTKLVASAVTILLTIGMIGCGNVESSQEVNLDSTITEVTEASVGNTTIEEETEKASEAISEATVEASTEATSTISEEVVEAVAETSASKETTETVTVEAVANASTNTETVQTSTSGTLTGETGPNGWPIIEYNGSADGTGPGLAWRSDINYLEKFPDMKNHNV